ncbi:MAG: elongation factor P [Verrucomicrobiota bacterium]
MASVVATNLKRGNCIRVQNELGIVQDLDHRTPGKGNALIMAHIRSLDTGKTKSIRFASSDKVEVVPTERQKLEYSYNDGSMYSFIDPNTYDQTDLSIDFVGDAKEWLTENMAVDVLFVDGNPASLELPPSVELVITESSEGIKGDTANNPTKPAKLETGVTVQVPLFVEQGERIRVDPTTGKYLGRAQ